MVRRVLSGDEQRAARSKAIQSSGAATKRRVLRIMSLAATPHSATVCRNFNPFGLRRITCSSSESNPRRGFGTKKTNKISKDGDPSSQKRKSTLDQPGRLPSQAPGVSSRFDGNYRKSTSTDLDFEERLKAVRRSAIEQKKVDEMKGFGAIDYDAPVETDDKTIGLGTKIGVGLAVVIFGLVFALGDFLPSGSDSPSEEAVVANKKLSEEEKATLQKRLQEFEATLTASPRDTTVLEGAAVTLAELGEYTKAAARLEELTKEKSNDPDAFRLLGDVKFELKDYEGSAAAYRTASKLSTDINFEVLRGLTNALLAAKKPDEAVRVLLASRDLMNSKKPNVEADGNTMERSKQNVDPIQVDLLLGKAYSDWGHVSDAVSVYDGLISSHPNDFRGYLAKGIILKENGRAGDAERMFIQARFFAPEKAKALVDRYAGQ
ncbi:uncharacterized protein LOC104423277 isoform X2 [Eucalyptus grandis]|uniref:Uncharacterized protein n=2 Tax=Eucalyptus grandis TaxID=71139 RepID=A0ACC3JBZ0_EUCGR|nr:uncharacterized protein LOC104423277 isoform X2 [Eucalyptus grandis]KAK3411209.1 hypothetical protein EUGRSUZ_J03184 [Eucalyptus grandis]